MTDAPYSPYIDRLGILWDGNDPEDVVIANALDEALIDLTSWCAAQSEGCDPAVVEHWDTRAYERLHAALTKDALVTAVIALVVPFAADHANGMVHQVRDLRETTTSQLPKG